MATRFVPSAAAAATCATAADRVAATQRARGCFGSSRPGLRPETTTTLRIMKLLLAPLFFQGRMCKHCARLFYKANPGAWLGLHEFESLPPLGSYDPRRGFVPDFPALLMFDDYVVDAEAYERLQNPAGRPWLKDWSELVDGLRAEGSLTTRDVGTAASARSHTRGAMLRRDLRHPEQWWQAMAYYNALTGRAERLLGSSPEEARQLSWDFDPDQRFGIEGSDGKIHDLAVVLADAADPSVPAHHELLGFALAEVKQHLREVNACLVACDELDVAPLMWAPYRRYMETKVPAAGAQALDQQEASRKFFDIAFPTYTPTTVREFLKARSNRAVTSLRSEIMRATETGDAIDPAYPQRVLTEVLRLEAKGARRRRIIGWIATAVGLIPVPGLGLAAAAAAEGISGVADRRRRRPWRWFYVISDGRGVT